MAFLKFLISKQFLINLLIAIVLVVIGYFILDSYMGNYTRHDEKVRVPRVIGENVEDLPNLLEKKGFRFALLDSVWDRTKPKGMVMEQKPIPNELVKEGRKIYITINARSTKKIKLNLDNILQSSVRGAIDNLSSVDIEIKGIEYESYAYSDIVLRITNESGREIKNNSIITAGSKIILVVGQTGLMKVEVPDLIGKSIIDAKNDVFSANLNAVVMAFENKSCTGKLDSTFAFIVKQEPMPNEKALSGSDVTLYYSCDSLLIP